MLESLITSQTRIRLLLKFFLNSNTSSYLRGLAEEFQESTNAIRIELNRLEKAGLLTATFLGNKKMYQANVKHPLFNEIHNILLKHTGIDQVIGRVTESLGNILRVYLIGEMAAGRDSEIIEIVLVGNLIDQSNLSRLCNNVEEMTGRTIQEKIISPEEETGYLEKEQSLFLLWEKAAPRITQINTD